MQPPFEAQIASHAHRVEPQEACGFVMRDKAGFLYTQEEPNIHRVPEECFAISPISFLSAKNSGRLVGIYHSQAGGPEPTDADKGGAFATSCPAFIYGRDTHTWSCY